MPRPVRRRRPLLVAAAVLLGLVVWLVVATGLERASERVQVWSVASEVSRGEAVEQAHLVPSEVAVSDRSAVLEVTDRSRCVVVPSQVTVRPDSHRAEPRAGASIQASTSLWMNFT